MEESARAHGQRPARERSIRPVLGAVGVTVSLLVVLLVAAAQREPALSTGVVAAALLALGVAAVVALTRTWRDAAVWLSIVGLVCVVVGSGIGRAHEEAFEGGAARQGRGGDVVARLDTSWTIVAIGALLVGGALIWAVSRRPREARSRPVLATGSLAVLTAGTVGIAAWLAEIVVGEWLA